MSLRSRLSMWWLFFWTGWALRLSRLVIWLRGSGDQKVRIKMRFINSANTKG